MSDSTMIPPFENLNDSNNLKNKNNNKRSYKDLNNKFLDTMTKAKRNKSDSEPDNDNLQSPNGPSNDNKYVMQQIKKLQTIIESQKKQINTLEKKTKDFTKRGIMLEDAVNDLYNIIEDYSDDYIYTDEEFDDDDDDYTYRPKIIGEIDISELNLDSNLCDNLVNKIITRSKNKHNKPKYTKTPNASPSPDNSNITNYSNNNDTTTSNNDEEDVDVENADNDDKGGDNDDDVENDEEEDEDVENDDKLWVDEDSNDSIGKRNTSKNNAKRRSNKVELIEPVCEDKGIVTRAGKLSSQRTSLNSNQNKNDTQNKNGKQHTKGKHIDIELSPSDLKRIYSNNGDKYLEHLIKEAIKQNNPEMYIEEFCKHNNLSASIHKDILQDYKLFKELNQNIYNKTETKVSDIDSFINNDCSKRKLILSSLQNLNARYENQDNYKFKILASGMNSFVQQQALYKIKQLENTEPGSGEYYKLKNWLDTLTTIPFNNYKAIDLSTQTVSQFLESSRTKMNDVIYGQDATKDIIIQIIAKMITNPGKCGNVFAIYGPPGVGKTTIIKEGMSKALGIPFAFLSLGGASDSSFLEGHGYTYEGSTPGKIVETLRKVQCMNPIMYFDELDKISETKKGEEIANLLIHLTDPSQNGHFQDKYLGDIDLDLSKSIFVFSFNNIEKVNPILLDRMELIYVDGFNNEDKTIIAKNYLIPELLDTYNLYSVKKVDTINTFNTLNSNKPQKRGRGRPKHNTASNSPLLSVNMDTNASNENTSTASNGVKEPDVVFSDENLDYIIRFNTINNIDHTKEDGVRGIKRRLEKICSNLNIIKLTNGNWTSNIHSILDTCTELKQCKFPITLSNETIKLLLLTNTQNNNSSIPYGIYM
jgi:ATP-dependent Lon protease